MCGTSQIISERSPCCLSVPFTSTLMHPRRGRISVEVNGTLKQQGDLSEMIWDVPHMLHFLSQYYELLPGDLVFTGTPAGVAAVVAGDMLIGRIESLGELRIRIV